MKLLEKGHKEKIIEQDYISWLSNQYTMSAVSVAVERCLAGKKAKGKYIEKPFLSTFISNSEMTEEEIMERKIKNAIMEEERYIAETANRGLRPTIIA